MASIYKTNNNRWIAAIRRKNTPSISKVFDKHHEAKLWAVKKEAELAQQKEHGIKHSLHEALNRYLIEFVPSYKGIKTATWQINFLKRHLADIPLEDFNSSHAASYRDQRLANGVSGSSVNKELNFLSKILDVAGKEWGWIDNNPVKNITRPKNGKHRERRPTQSELEILRNECERSGNYHVWRMIEFAIETGMRQGEILSLTTFNVDLNKRMAHLADTKNGESRNVPLSRRACELLSEEINSNQTTRVFSKWSSGDGFRSTYRRICERTGITDLRFHDFRHEAASRFFEMGLNQFQVAAITGHKSLQSLHRYTHINTETLLEVIA